MMRILKVALLLGIGYVFATGISMLGAQPLEQYEILFLCAFPAGWVFTGKHFGHFSVSGSFIAWLFFWVIKILVGSIIGWGVVAVETVRGLIELIAAPFAKHSEDVEEDTYASSAPQQTSGYAAGYAEQPTYGYAAGNVVAQPVYGYASVNEVAQPAYGYASGYSNAQPAYSYAGTTGYTSGSYGTASQTYGVQYQAQPPLPSTAAKGEIASPYDFFGLARPASAYEA